MTRFLFGLKLERKETHLEQRKVSKHVVTRNLDADKKLGTFELISLKTFEKLLDALIKTIRRFPIFKFSCLQ